MDRNQATGLILMALLLILYVQFFAPQPTKPEEITDTPPKLVEDKSNQQIQQPDSIQYGAVSDTSNAVNVTEEIIQLENEHISVSFSTRGGTIKEVVLKEYDTYKGEELVLVDSNNEDFDWSIRSGNEIINLSNELFQASQTTIGDTAVIDFNLITPSGERISYRYMLPPAGYQMMHHISSSSSSLGDLSLNWTDKINRVERDIEISRINTTVSYLTANGDYETLPERSEELEEENIQENIKWVSIKQKFFTAAIISEKPFSQGYVATTVDKSNTKIVKTAKISLVLSGASLGSETSFKYFFGPNKYEILDGVATDFSKNLDLGWPPMSWVNKFVLIPLFNLLSGITSNYGIIIFIMVMIIKLVLFPLSYKSYVSMAKMKVLKPQLDEIREKHGGDQMKAQQDQMKLYQSVGVNPVSGCIPMLLQMPILLAMFYFFPESVELRQESFLWADDLSTYDVLVKWDTYIPILSSIYGNHISLFVLLMTGSSLLYTWSNQQVSTVQGPMATFSYLMPVVFMFVLNSYPAALSYYYFLSNLITFGQQWAIRKFVDDEKILKKLEENKKKMGTKKKSTFQQRIEEAMRASQEAKKNKKK